MYDNVTEALRAEITADHEANKDAGLFYGLNYLRGKGFTEDLHSPIPIARAKAFAYLLKHIPKFVYKNELILGNIRSVIIPRPSDEEVNYYQNYNDRFGRLGFQQGVDHYAPAYDLLLSKGVKGILSDIEESKQRWADDREKQVFLEACRIEMEAFSELLKDFGAKSDKQIVRDVCERISTEPPASFHEGLQLVWMAHTAFSYQGLYAMALGRLDQYLYPLYKHDIDAGIITRDDARTLLENTFMHHHDHSRWIGDDVNNICIGGITPEGENAVNDLSYDILYSVGKCNIPGPNLSARINPLTPDEFLCESLKVIGTGLGYPALMNDIPNIKALKHMGYEERDANNYCMVGCIENFIPGSQPPWSDGRFDNCKILEYTLNRGCDMLNGEKRGIDTGDPCEFKSMDEFMKAYEKQLAYAASEYALNQRLSNARFNRQNYVNPFMSCLTYKCIERGLDINDGGTIYPSAHGACLMGIGTITDSLSAIEKLVYEDRTVTMETLIKALKANYEGYEDLRQQLLAVPKYGNDCEKTDKYAVWFVKYNSDLFDQYRQADGGRFYTAIASNTSNIGAGHGCAASPDGRKAHEPLSDAASPTYGRDHRGPTCTVKSTSKPDYSRVACGTVLNQKYSPNMFSNDDNIKRLCALVRVYFGRGGQEMQINSVSREVLIDAMEHPEKYQNLVVRVSGFSAYFVRLNREVQQDILNRTVQY
ncbi:MAG: pyruvate formate lyase family protein [Firmicutes bacterium]|nr:pyruvate formate lyase family protein [Bacillota bacterium]